MKLHALVGCSLKDSAIVVYSAIVTGEYVHDSPQFKLLATDVMQDRELAMRLVGHFECLETLSRTHHQFFFSLGQLLSTKHEIRRVPREELSRKAFECSFKRTAEKLGV